MAISRVAAFAILGLSGDATHDQISRAYRRMAREVHPDRCAAPDAARRFGELREAYQQALRPEPADAAASVPASAPAPAPEGTAKPPRPGPARRLATDLPPTRRPDIVAGPVLIEPPSGDHR